MARPMRRPAPVTKATCPWRFTPRQQSNTESRNPGAGAVRIRRRCRAHALQSGRLNSGGAMKLDLLAIAAHPDDAELTCGGTLIKMAHREIGRASCRERWQIWRRTS